MTDLPDKTTVPPWWADGRLPTNRELVDWLSVTSDANRDWWFDRIQQNSQDAGRCFEMGHDSLQERLDSAHRMLREANERISWLERNYYAGKPA